jgi:Ca2+-binding EF-hand superfamily protein
MRLKISFDDVKKLFKFLDKNNNGCLGYEEFTFLLEERWRGIDPNQVLKESLKGLRNPMQVT